MFVDVAILPVVGVYVLVLVCLEGLLSADNALVLALMVRHLPKIEQKRALRYGIWGAIAFRLIAVILSAKLMNFWLFKVAGGLFLFYLSISHFVSRHNDPDAPPKSRFGRGFWGTVISVELADIAFSIDSILAAVAMVDGLDSRFDSWKLPIVFIGGVFGILTMRYVAQYFIILLEKFRGLEAGAYVLVAWIGVKLIASGFHDPKKNHLAIPEWLFWTVMALIVVISLLYKPGANSHQEKSDETLVEVANILDEEQKG
jgi:YkoY family integral membrane protein